MELAIYIGSRKHFEKRSHVCSGERFVSKYHLLSFTQKDSMSNMHTLIHDNTFVIIQEIRAFHKIVVASACSPQLRVAICVHAKEPYYKKQPRPDRLLSIRARLLSIHFVSSVKSAASSASAAALSSLKRSFAGRSFSFI